MQTQQLLKSLEYWQSSSLAYYRYQNNMSIFCFTLLNMLKAGQAKNILDAGCGGGYLHPYLISKKNNATKLTGIDCAENMILISAARVKKYLDKGLGNLDDMKTQAQLIYMKVLSKRLIIIYVLEVLRISPNSKKILSMYIFLIWYFLFLGTKIKHFKKLSEFFSQEVDLGQLLPIKEIMDALFEVGLLPNIKDNSYIDRYEIINRVRQFGFDEILCWSQEVAFPLFSYDEIMNFVSPISQPYFEKASQEQKDQITNLVSKRLQEKQSQNEPLMMSCLLLTARKPK